MTIAFVNNAMTVAIQMRLEGALFRERHGSHHVYYRHSGTEWEFCVVGSARDSHWVSAWSTIKVTYDRQKNAIPVKTSQSLLWTIALQEYRPLFATSITVQKELS